MFHLSTGSSCVYTTLHTRKFILSKSGTSGCSQIYAATACVSTLHTVSALRTEVPGMQLDYNKHCITSYSVCEGFVCMSGCSSLASKLRIKDSLRSTGQLE